MPVNDVDLINYFRVFAGGASRSQRRYRQTAAKRGFPAGHPSGGGRRAGDLVARPGRTDRRSGRARVPATATAAVARVERRVRRNAAGPRAGHRSAQDRHDGRKEAAGDTVRGGRRVRSLPTRVGRAGVRELSAQRRALVPEGQHGYILVEAGQEEWHRLLTVSKR